MEETDRHWLQKIETQGRETLSTLIEVKTILNIYTQRQDQLDSRVSSLEEYKHRQEGVNQETTKKHNKILVIVIASEVVLFGIGLFLTHFSK